MVKRVAGDSDSPYFELVDNTLEFVVSKELMQVNVTHCMIYLVSILVNVRNMLCASGISFIVLQ